MDALFSKKSWEVTDLENKIRSAFEQVKASDKMKSSTIQYLQQARTAKSPKSTVYSWRRSLVAACAMLFIVAGIGGLYTVQTPVSYVSIDVNPSIELALNRYDRVVSATAYNEDAATILDGLKVNGLFYIQAFDVIGVSFLTEAHGCGMSFGKYVAYLTLSQYDDTITTEDCQHMTMGEIHSQISAHESGEEHGNNEMHHSNHTGKKRGGHH